MFTACISAILVGMVQGRGSSRGDLQFATFATAHLEAYQSEFPAFEAEHKLTIRAEVVSWQALESRLRSAMMAGTHVPDVVELQDGSMGFFASGPLEDVGLLDLTDRIHAEGLDRDLVESRFSLWSSRGRIFALPHDVHPVMLAYRRDLVEQLGIDVDQIQTWDDFVKVGRRITVDQDGDGLPDRYAIDLAGGAWGVKPFLLQRGISMFSADGRVAFDVRGTAEVLAWHIAQLAGPRRIGYSCGFGQPLAKAMTDGLVLFYPTPDWKSKFYEKDSPHLAGKMALMPLPAWEKGGRRTSTIGGTGVAITKNSAQPELAWQLVKKLYLDKQSLGARFAKSNIIPSFVPAWQAPELDAPNSYYSGQKLGTLYAALAPDVPATSASPFQSLAEQKIDEVYAHGTDYVRARGEDGLVPFLFEELVRAAGEVRTEMARNVFFKQ